MKKQFLHESHLRQDRAKKGDYRAEMEPSRSRASHSEILIAKSEARRIFIDFFEDGEVNFAGYSFRFTWDFADFARNNNLDSSRPEVKRVFDELRHSAGSLVNSVKGDYRSARLKIDPEGRVYFG